MKKRRKKGIKDMLRPEEIGTFAASELSAIGWGKLKTKQQRKNRLKPTHAAVKRKWDCMSDSEKSLEMQRRARVRKANARRKERGLPPLPHGSDPEDTD